MSSQNTDVELRVVAVVLVAVIVLVTGFAVGLGIHKSRGGAASVVVTPATVVFPAPAAVAATPSDDASVVVENGVVKFYFASGKADLAPGALVALRDAIAAAKAGKRLVLSGFHDATGDPSFNAELARQRALALRNALVGAGVSDGNMELKKPEQTTGTGNDAEARRVEVVIVG